MTRLSLLPLLILLVGSRAEPDQCVKPLRAGTPVQGHVRVCPGRYRIADPAEKGVFVIATSGSSLDLTGVTLESGDTGASAFVGRGVMARNVDSISIRGGRIS